MSITNYYLRSTLLAVFALAVFAAPSFADSTYTTADTVAAVVSKDDGPHVYWQDDSTASAIYYYDGKMIREEIARSANPSFDGFFWDDTISYRMHPAFNTPKLDVVTGASKILAISDIHGEYGYFVDILQATGVIDSARHWIWGDGHLVIAGDIFDRGARVTECLWLVYHLEAEAAKAGGGVHFALGNHELMCIRDDLRYVHERYLTGIARRNRINYSDLFGTTMELGRWLRTKHALIKINDILFLHGGISPALIDSAFSINEINTLFRELLDMPAQELLFNQRSKFLTSSFGPVWYRGFHYEMEGRYPQSTSDDIDRLLKFFDAKAVVVGHTGVDSISSLFGGRVFAVDIPFEDIHCIEALLWNEDGFHRVLCDGELRGF